MCVNRPKYVRHRVRPTKRFLRGKVDKMVSIASSCCFCFHCQLRDSDRNDDTVIFTNYPQTVAKGRCNHELSSTCKTEVTQTRDSYAHHCNSCSYSMLVPELCFIFTDIPRARILLRFHNLHYNCFVNSTERSRRPASVYLVHGWV